MPSFFTIISILALLVLVVACSGNKVQGDIHPDIPELPAVRSEQLSIQQLDHIATLHYSADGTIHAFGRLPEDTSLPEKTYKYLLVYNSGFELLSTQFITKRRIGIAFVDPQSNVYITNKNRNLVRLSYPDYKEEMLLPPHPISSHLQGIMDKELRNRGPRQEEHQQLIKENKESIIKQNQQAVAKELQAAYEQELDLDAIAYGILYANKYVLFMKNGAVYTLINYQGMNGKAAVSSFFKQQKKVVIYKHYDREDKGSSIANMMLLEQQKASKSPVQQYLVQTDFAATEKKTTLENWPNPGYTKGFYYYQLNLEKASAAFKIKGSTASKGRHLHVIAKEKAPICFLSGRGWFLIKEK